MKLAFDILMEESNVTARPLIEREQQQAIEKGTDIK